MVRLLCLMLVGAFAWFAMTPVEAEPLLAEGPAKGPGESLAEGFASPPDSARAGAYWYFLDGNQNREQMTADLEAMHDSGLRHVILLEVDLGFPKGPTKFMSEAWRANFVHAVRECERLGMTLRLGTGPGWTGSGGPWVPATQSMRHLVSGRLDFTGPGKPPEPLPTPAPREPFFGSVGADLQARRDAYYEDVAVIAFPTPTGDATIADLDEKSLVYRAPYTSAPNVKAFLPEPPLDQNPAVPLGGVVDLTGKLQPDGKLDWDAPAGDWTILRLGMRNNGANTRPAPQPGYGFESDKLSTTALDAHFDHYVNQLLADVGNRKPGTGWTTLHMDSWEMGSQNWTDDFAEQFEKRRDYDPTKFLPAYAGVVVGTPEVTERFLWDIRQTAKELVLENHAGHVKKIAHDHGMNLSIEPYDMNPSGDLSLGSIADVPMAEFWTEHGWNAAFSVIESAGIAHTIGSPVMAAEAFTSEPAEKMSHYPTSLKDQADWAFAGGVNQFFFHTFAHQPLGDDVKPGMTFGPYGVHWHRNQTWWPMAEAFHEYLARCSFMLQQGVTVADILYLAPEGSPQVFVPPPSAMTQGNAPHLPDRRGYNFDGVAPETFINRATVDESGRIAFENGSTYRVLVLPAFDSMTPALLDKVGSLIKAGATVIGGPPSRSPSLSNYPACDETVATLAATIWGSLEAPDAVVSRDYGDGTIYWGGDLEVASPQPPASLYPTYDAVAAVLKSLGVPEDFSADQTLRYTHRRTGDADIYFISNTTAEAVSAACTFRTAAASAELWDPVTGDVWSLPAPTREGNLAAVTVQLPAHGSAFVVFPVTGKSQAPARPASDTAAVATLNGPWRVAFDPSMGGPEQIEFDSLVDWTEHAEPGVRYYSGIATYRRTFDADPTADSTGDPIGDRQYLDLGVVHDLARVRLNGRDLGVVWTAPWRVDITDSLVAGENRLEIDVANRWANRLIGDQQPENKDVRQLFFDDGIFAGGGGTAGRYTYVTFPYFTADAPLLPSGLIGPVTIRRSEH